MQGKANLSSKNTGVYAHLISRNHILYRIKKLIDFSFIFDVTEHCYHPNNGRPAVSAELYFKMLLIGYLFNIQSNRRLADEIHYNILYRWFCDLDLGDKIPHHATLSRTRKRLGVDVFERIFHEILNLCREKGLLRAESSVMTDSTLFQANASLDSLKPKDDTYIPNDSKKTFSNKTHISRTDPDASFAFKAGTVRSLKYKAHITTDAQSRIILAIKITTGAVHDSIPYLEQLEYVIQKSKINLIEVIADKAYGTGEIIQSLKNNGIKSNIPLFSSRSGSSENSAIEGFSFEPLGNHYLCPNKKKFSPCKSQGETTIYISKASDCASCPLKNSCGAKIKNKGPGRYVTRNQYQELYVEIRQQMNDILFKQKLTERMWKIEGVMNEIKNYHTLSRAQFRGLENVQIQAYMAAIAINIKRLVYCFLNILRIIGKNVQNVTAFATGRRDFYTIQGQLRHCFRLDKTIYYYGRLQFKTRSWL